ncbi:MAG: CAP domain-containing protein [Chthoniobacteraceae bacterium]
MRLANQTKLSRIFSAFQPVRLALVAVITFLGHTALAVPLDTNGVALGSQQLQIVSAMASNSGQHRPFLKVDPTLTAVAMARARDMAVRHYFAHVNPDGHGPNYLVRAAGYPLPDWWGTDPQANYIESIAAGYTNPSDAWTGWMNSTPHRTHLLAEDSFYSDQTSVGLGYYYDSSSDYKYYWVVITCPPRPAAPLTIKDPSNNSTVTEANVTATGTTSAASNATAVEYAVQSTDGTTTSYQKASGLTNWQASITNLAPGNNTLLVRSRDSGGSIVATAQRTIHYAMMRALDVEANGNGSVSKNFAGITQREVGKVYTVTAIAKRGYLFAGWTGSKASNNATVAFTMAEGYTLTANFVANPFTSVTNTYQGLIETSAGAGLVKIVSTSNGHFLGKLKLDGVTTAFTGKFDLNGAAQVSVPTTGGDSLTFNLQIDLTNGTNQITGNVTDGSNSASLSLDGKTYDATTNPAPEAGIYTMVLPADSSNSSAPTGDGTATVKIAKSGQVLINGTLADGTKFTTASFITTDGQIVLYVPLYQKTGSLSGTLSFASSTSTDFSGTLTWDHPQTSTSVAFTESLDATGSVVTQ